MKQTHLFDLEGPESDEDGRDRLDRYYTPEWATQALVDYMGDRLSGHIWDPCCGKDWGGRVFRRSSHVTAYYGTDIDPDVCAKPVDFLTTDASDFCDWIATNPPYQVGERTAADFVQHALRGSASVAMLLSIRWLEACRDRSDIFNADPPTDVLIIGRVQFIGAEKRNNLPSVWCIWDRSSKSKCTHLYWHQPKGTE